MHTLLPTKPKTISRFAFKTSFDCSKIGEQKAAILYDVLSKLGKKL